MEKTQTGLTAECRAKLTLYLSDKQVAARYSVTRECAWKWAREVTDFPKPVKLTPGCTRWRLADLEAWEAAQASHNEGEAA